MLYQISTGFDGVKQFSQQEIVYIVTSLDKIREHHLPYFFTDGHIRSFTSTSYNDDKYLEKLDWNAISIKKYNDRPYQGPVFSSI